MLKNLSQRLSQKNMFWQFQSVKHAQLLRGGDQHKYFGFLC